MQIGEIVFRRPTRGTGHNELPSFVLRQGMHPVGEFCQNGHHCADFALARAGKHGDYRFVRESAAFQEVLACLFHRHGIVHGIDKRIALVEERNALFLEIWDFKREYYIESVDIFLQLSDAAFTGRPNLRRYVVEHFKSACVGKFGNLEVESRIVYEYHAVGGETQNVLLAAPEVAEQLARLGEYLGEAHDGSFFVVSDKTPYLWG